MRYDYRAANQSGNTHRLIHLAGRKTHLPAFAEMILNTIIASKDERTGKPDELFRFYIQRAFQVRVCVEVENSFQNQIIGLSNLIIHLASVIIELLYDVHVLKFSFKYPATGVLNQMVRSNTILEDFLSLFFPRHCMACGGAMAKGEDILCTACIGELPKTNYHLQQDNPVKNRLAGRLPLCHGWAFLKFRKGGMVQHLLHELKYNQHPEIGIKLGQVYGYDLMQSGHHKEFDLIIPVPLHASRKRQRGYNQSAKFAEGLSLATNIPWDESVSVRKRSTSTQTDKSKAERWENVKDVFSIDGQKRVGGKRILLVDDVITTGATLEACGLHLVSSGCSELSVACLAEAQ
jgi:ComF family protein